jgi:hypothetical protein
MAKKKNNDSIRLHPEHGLNPTIIQYQCPVTGQIWQSNELALLGYNKNKKANMYSTAGTKICPEVQEQLDKGFVVFIIVDEEKTTDMNNPFRTGELMYMKKEAALKMFDQNIKDIAFLTIDAYEKIKSQIKE